MSKITATGSCLCGSVRYQVTGPVADITACPGTDTCKLGIASSRGLASACLEELNKLGE